MPDLIGITESRLKDNFDAPCLEGYHDFVGEPTITDAGGAGIYIKDTFDYKIRDDLHLKVDRCENIWIELLGKNKNNQTKESPIIIAVIYRHPGSNYLAFCSNLRNSIEKINQFNGKFVLMGDININLLKYNLVNTVTDYLRDIIGSGCQSFINVPTRVFNRGSRWEITCPDHMYSNIDPKLIDAYVIRSGISDHFSTLATIKGVKRFKMSDVCLYKRKSKLTVEELSNFNSDLINALQSGVVPLSDMNVNERTDFILLTYRKLIDKYMPLRKLSRKEKRFYFKPWISKGIKISIKNRDIMYRKSFAQN